MSKITFRADDDLVDRLDSLDASKSEVMREALRSYLDTIERESERETPSDTGTQSTHTETDTESLDAVLSKRIDELVTERLAKEQRHSTGTRSVSDTQPVTVNVTLEDATRSQGRDAQHSSIEQTETVSETQRKTDSRKTDTPSACTQCGESVLSEHVYCPNCGEKASNRLFCECGDEVRSDWAFCPGCGRRTPAADVLDRKSK